MKSLFFLLSLINFSDARFLIRSQEPLNHQGVTLLGSYNNIYTSYVDCNISVAEYFQNLPQVSLVEDDSEVYLEDSIKTDLWNLDLIDSKVDGFYNNYDRTAKDINVYVIDSGVSKHEEFENRLLMGKGFGFNTSEDCNGHGTHVASTIAGKKYGVAKQANIISARVFPCYGGSTWSRIIEAMYWVLPQKKGIVNMSIGGGYSRIVNEAVNDLIDSGHVVVVAAGNYATDACDFSPSSAKNALTVGCIDKNLNSCYFSNEGSCVDLFAPGSSIIGANIPFGGTSKSGTSMSSPHVAGVAAIVKEMYPKMSSLEINDEVIRLTAKNTLKLRYPDSPNRSLRLPTVQCFKFKKNKCKKIKLCKWFKKRCLLV